MRDTSRLDGLNVDAMEISANSMIGELETAINSLKNIKAALVDLANAKKEGASRETIKQRAARVRALFDGPLVKFSDVWTELTNIRSIILPTVGKIKKATDDELVEAAESYVKQQQATHYTQKR